jgi:hypothetical protein
MKSLSATVETDETVGAAPAAVHVLTAVFGSPEAGSNGVVVSAPETPNAIAEAAVGAEESATVITSEDTAVAATPYHSMWVAS